MVAFSGDFADFQWLQNVIERIETDIRSYHSNTKLTAKGLYSRLTSLLYYRRSQMNPVWTTLVVAGLTFLLMILKLSSLLRSLGMHPEPTYDNLVPFIGVISPKGMAYETKAVATSIGQMILTETMNRDARAREFKLTRDEAHALLRKMLEVIKYRDCTSSGDYDLTTIDASGATLERPEKIVGSWEVADYPCHF